MGLSNAISNSTIGTDNIHKRYVRALQEPQVTNRFPVWKEVKGPDSRSDGFTQLSHSYWALKTLNSMPAR